METSQKKLTTVLRDKAIELLARREHSRYELHHKLRSREFPSDEIEVCLEQLEQEKLLSDERFAEAYVRMRGRNGFGPVRIRCELNGRGIGDELASCALSAAGIDWLDSIRKVYEKKYSLEMSADFAEQAKRLKFLSYRGFTGEQIKTFLGAIESQKM